MKQSILFLIMLVFLSTNLYAEDMQRYYFNKVTGDDVINVRQAPNGNIIGQLKYYNPYTKWTLYEFDGESAMFINTKAYFGSFKYETNGEIYSDGLSMTLLEDARENNGWYKIEFFDAETVSKSIGYIHQSQIEYIPTPNNIEVLFGYNPNLKGDKLAGNYDKYDMFCLNREYYLKPLVNSDFKQPYIDNGACNIIVSLKDHFPMGYVCSYNNITLQDLYNKRLFWSNDEKMPKEMPNKTENKILSIKDGSFTYDYDYQVNVYDKNNIVISYVWTKDKEFKHRYLFSYDENIKKATLLKCTGK